MAWSARRKGRSTRQAAFQPGRCARSANRPSCLRKLTVSEPTGSARAKPPRPKRLRRRGKLDRMSRKAIDDAALEAEIGRLPALSLLELRHRWKTLFGHPAPKSLRRNFLARAVAYQIQVEAYVGLSFATKHRLRDIANAVRTGDANAMPGSSRTTGANRDKWRRHPRPRGQTEC